jgi:hypothetical protein
MSYEIIQPPFTLKFREMSKQELADYARWFQSSIPERLSQLEAAVRATLGYEHWAATCERDSLAALGEWFAAEVMVRPRKREEVAELQRRSGMLASPPVVDLTNRSFSLAMDVGMYLARTLERTHPHLQWKQFLDNKKFADYGQPVLMGFGPVPLNPIRIAVSLAYGIAAGNQSGKRLSELFDYWSGQAGQRQGMTN